MLYPASSAGPPQTDRKPKYTTPSDKGALTFGRSKEIENVIHDMCHQLNKC